MGFTRTYLNWGYTVADGAAIAVVIGLYSRFLSLKQLALFGCFLLCATFLMVGGARGPLLGVGLAGLVVIAVRLPRIGPDRFEVSVGQIAGITIGIMAVGMIVVMIASGRATTTLNRFVTLADQAEGEKGVTGASRWLYWPAAVRYYLESPIIGYGFASFSYVFHSGSERPGGHPHNVVLETAAELGTIGLILFFLFVWSGVRHASLRRLGKDPLMVCVLAYFLTAIQSSMFAKELAGGRKLFLAVALFAVPAASHALRAARSGTRPPIAHGAGSPRPFPTDP